MSIVKSKIRASFFGVLMGDCYGAIYEGDSMAGAGSRKVLSSMFKRLEEDGVNGPRMAYTDDTAMSIAVARTLIERREIDQPTLASNFVSEYIQNTRRNYGKGMIAILEKWHRTNFVDLLEPAKQLFGGAGSTGNGAAMRIAPIAHFCHNRDVTDVLEMARQSAVITHTNQQAIIGCQLQALAIHALLRRNSADPIVATQFLQQLEIDLKRVGICADNSEALQAYCNKINGVERLLASDPSDETVINALGNSCHAIESVPTAIYCFLRSLQPIKGIETTNQMRRSIEFAIRFGGDTDTIASMAGALSGAFGGDAGILPNLTGSCEASEQIDSLAGQIYDASLI